MTPPDTKRSSFVTIHKFSDSTKPKGSNSAGWWYNPSYSSGLKSCFWLPGGGNQIVRMDCDSEEFHMVGPDLQPNCGGWAKYLGSVIGADGNIYGMVSAAGLGKGRLL